MELSREREKLLRRLRRRRGREREALFLVEGIRSAAEALDAASALRFAVVSSRLEALAGGPELRARLRAAGTDLVEVHHERLAELADTESSQGVLLVCAEPGTRLEDLPAGRPLLVLDGIQDPGNVGTLVRAAAAFAVPGVVALDGTADPYGPKAVRAAAGGLFRTALARASWPELEAWLAGAGVPLLVADVAGDDVGRVAPGPAWALAVGNEGGGARPELRAAATRTVRIPMPGGAESLNAGVAGAILLYVLSREGWVD